MKEKKKKNSIRIVKPNSINYTFTNDIAILPNKDDGQNKDRPKKKTSGFTRKTVKDLTRIKKQYIQSKSPKSQHAHSSVYE